VKSLNEKVSNVLFCCCRSYHYLLIHSTAMSFFMIQATPTGKTCVYFRVLSYQYILFTRKYIHSLIAHRAIGMTVAHIAKVVLDDSRRIIPVSTCVRGLQGVTEDVFLSLPCVVGALGVENIVNLKLTASEKAAFQVSAEKVWDIQKDVWDSL